MTKEELITRLKILWRAVGQGAIADRIDNDIKTVSAPDFMAQIATREKVK